MRLCKSSLELCGMQKIWLPLFAYLNSNMCADRSRVFDSNESYSLDWIGNKSAGINHHGATPTMWVTSTVQSERQNDDEGGRILIWPGHDWQNSSTRNRFLPKEQQLIVFTTQNQSPKTRTIFLFNPYENVTLHKLSDSNRLWLLIFEFLPTGSD